MQKAVSNLRTLRRLNPEGYAWLKVSRRVRKGIYWLIQNAPAGWHRNLFEPHAGGSWFRARNSYANERVIALAFESRSDLADDSEGYVRYATVALHFGLGFREAERLGFDCAVGENITSDLLDREWERQLRLGAYAPNVDRYYLASTHYHGPEARELARRQRAQGYADYGVKQRSLLSGLLGLVDPGR